MYRYFILAWNSRNPSQAATADVLSGLLQANGAQWTRRVERRGLLGLDAGTRVRCSEAHSLNDGSGAIFGTLFHRSENEPPAPLAALDADETSDVAALGARQLLDHYWGRYVAAAEHRASASIWILRDPSGTLPCFLTRFRGVNVFFSDLEDCLALKLLRFTVNWSYVAAATANSALQVRETGLNQVTEVLPGECVEIEGDNVRRTLLWNPVEIAGHEVVESTEDATTELHQTVHACVRAWRSCYEGILHSLSGGLDSSIVLSCLMQGAPRPNVTCLNYYASGPDEDERRYARLAAQRAGVALIERLLTVEEVRLESILQVRRTARPGYYVAALQRQRLESQLAHTLGANAIFSGGGGDAVFYQGRSDLAVADFVQRHGLRPGPWGGLWQVAIDAARITGLPVWPLIRRGVRTGLLRPRWRPFGDGAGGGPHGGIDGGTIVNAAAIESSRNDPRWCHPWLENTEGIPHGTLWHVLSLSVPASFYESFDQPTDPERAYPLLSQPLIELCLRIPTYALIAGGWDRAIARRAFAGELPREITQRRAKGGINRLSRQILEANLPFIREMLLDGLLVRERILDRARLEACLSGRRSPTDFENIEILHEHLSIEAWLRRGHELQSLAAA